MTLHEQALQCAQLIKNARAAAVISGAGLSTAAGIPDFRGPGGIYSRADVDPERLFDIDAFYHDPSYYYRFHRECVDMLKNVSPTFTHRFLAQLESRGRLNGIVTQNFDGLHEAAGSRNVYQIHGTIRHAHCLKCGKSWSYDDVAQLLTDSSVPRCQCGGVIKPDIVFFGENVKYLDECQRLCRADLLFVLGSSLNVTPAALLPQMCEGRIVVVNKGPVSSAYLPATRIFLRVSADLDQFFEEVSRLL